VVGGVDEAVCGGSDMVLLEEGGWEGALDNSFACLEVLGRGRFE
jgi:hypothetical protein